MTPGSDTRPEQSPSDPADASPPDPVGVASDIVDLIETVTQPPVAVPPPGGDLLPELVPASGEPVVPSLSMSEPLHADHVARKDFSVSFRGFGQHEVRAFLGQVGAELAACHEREQELRSRVTELEAVPQSEFDEAALEAALGREATKVIHAAREAAAEIRIRAVAEAKQVVAEADALLASRTTEAEELAASILDESRARATTLLGEATSERDRVLDQLAAQRRSIDAELTQLHGARDRLVAAYEVVRRTLDSAVAEVTDADDAAAFAPPPAVEPEPVVLTVVEAPEPDDRRSSSLRLLRRTADPSMTDPPPSDPIETVRIIRAEPEPEPEPAVASEPEAAEAPAAEVEVDASASTVFARLRADRAEKVASAVAVLASIEPETDAAGDPEPVTEAEAPVSQSPDLALLAARDDAVVDAERSVVRSLKRALADEQNEVLDALRRLRGAPTIAALLPDVAVHDARFDAVLSGGAAAAAAAAGMIAGGSGGSAGKVATDLGRSVAADIRLRIGRAVEESSGDVETLAEAISAAYREWKTSRVEPLARDAIAAAFASGLYAAASGELRWVVDPAEGGCPDCDDNALAGPTAKGSPFPTGQRHPPAHAGCRCAVVAVS